MTWPVEKGRYRIGSKISPVAVCTEATVEGIKLEMDKVAIMGKCVTENVGVERIVKNIISNPYIRFLIVCGKQSKGHDVGQTLMMLQQKGVDKKKRVIGSTGAIPLLKHLKKSEIERFRKQVQVFDLRDVTTASKIMMKVNWCLKHNPGRFKGRSMKVDKMKKKKVKVIKAQVFDKKYTPDPKGSFQISLDKKKGVIIAQHFNADFEEDYTIVGKSAQAVSDTIIKKSLIGDFKEALDHAAYLGQELAKAQWCLENGWDYEQDREIKNKELGIRNQELGDDEWGW